MKHIKREKWLAQFQKNRDKVMKLRAQGKTLEAIAETLGISRQRCGQIVKKEGAKSQYVLYIDSALNGAIINEP